MLQQTEQLDPPRIYVACLSSYNAGRLHGEWIDCNQDVEEIRNEVREMLKNSPMPNAEEWAIHAYENWHGIRIAELESLTHLSDLAQLIVEHGVALAKYYDHFGELQGFEDHYMGCYESEEDFVESSLDDQGLLNQWEKAGLNPSYVDFEKIARDWFINDYVSEKESFNKIHVFCRH